VVDTSGSMSDDMLADIANELTHMTRDREVFITECDAEIHTTYRYTKRIREVEGRGGTSFIPPLESSFLGKMKADLVVFFTDGFGPAPDRKPQVPVIWCLALRFGDAQGEDERVEARAEQVRIAFNSPFQPFVLATTSIGQEGLDFHQYCHEIFHWNLPANPVDLEQREGRIHRYKGHVIRRNIAAAYPLSSLASQVGKLGDLWQAAFEQACAARETGQNDLVPYWIFEAEDGPRVYRHIPSLPLSRDLQHLDSEPRPPTPR